MTIEKLNLENLMQRYSITKLRGNQAYVKLCEAHCKGLGTIQDAINYMTDMLDIDKASGVWLDYIGWLVGTTRSFFDIARFFCVNSADLGVEKYFYFPNETQWSKGNLDDVIFRQRIKAKVGYNISKGTREENIYIIKNLTNADRAVITKAGYKKLNVHLYGENIIFSNVNSLREDITNIFGATIGLNELEIN